MIKKREAKIKPMVKAKTMGEWLLNQRGVEEDLESFFNPSEKQLIDPFELKYMREAVNQAKLAIEEGQMICIYGDV